MMFHSATSQERWDFQIDIYELCCSEDADNYSYLPTEEVGLLGK